jgi:hypothetical protein
MQCCSHACSYVRDGINRLEKFARAGGTNPLAAEVWAAAATWNDDLTDYTRHAADYSQNSERHHHNETRHQQPLSPPRVRPQCPRVQPV